MVLTRRLAWQKNNLGKHHPKVARTREDMGLVYSDQSKFDDALREYEEALRIQMATLGKNHPRVAATRSNMASVYKEQSKFSKQRVVDLIGGMLGKTLGD